MGAQCLERAERRVAFLQPDLFSLVVITGRQALLVALNRAYDVKEGRPFWKSQLLALGITMALCLLVIGGVILITFGDPLLKSLGNSWAWNKEWDQCGLCSIIRPVRNARPWQGLRLLFRT